MPLRTGMGGRGFRAGRGTNSRTNSLIMGDVPDGDVGSSVIILIREKEGGHMNRTLKMLLRTGLSILEQSDRATEPVREQIAETADLLQRKIRGEDHTLRYVLTFAAGVGVGVGVGILTAPGSGAQSRNSISEKVREVGKRIKPQPGVGGDFATGSNG